MEPSGRNRTRNRKRWYWAVGISIALLAAFVVPRSWLFEDASDNHQHDGDAPEQNWACPMLCVMLDSPGICPVCGMDLEPIELTGDEVVLSMHDQEMIDLTLAEVEWRSLHREFTLPGQMDFDLSGVYTVTAWTGGRIDRLHVTEPGQLVSEGQVVAEIYSPELYSAQQELLALAASEGLQGSRVQLAREKLRLLGMSNYSIDALLSRGQASTSSSIAAPASGNVTSISVSEGQYTSQGSVLLELADLSTVWLTAFVTEDYIDAVVVGQEVSFILDSRPSASYSGVVDLIEPFFAGSAAAGNVRISLQNPAGDFLPGQSASVTFFDGNGDTPVLSIPRSSVLRLGQRSVAYLLTGPIGHRMSEDGLIRVEEARFRPVEIVHGPLSADSTGVLYYPVYEGLAEGDLIALQGAFLIDSQAELLGLPSLLSPDTDGPGTQ